MKTTLLILLSVLVLSCGTKDSGINGVSVNLNEQLSIVNIDSVNVHLKGLGHKTVSKFRNNTLTIDLFVDNDDYVSKNYINILCELIICNIAKDIDPINKVVIVESLETGVRNQSPIVVDSTMVKQILLANTFKVYYDFKKYIVQNIRGDKMGKLNMIIEHIIKDQKDPSTIPLKEYDFITATKLYAAEYCLPKEKNEFYKKLFLAIKETASDKELWPDFKSQDIDYFLDYCNKSEGS